jgi:hypothetical protein
LPAFRRRPTTKKPCHHAGLFFGRGEQWLRRGAVFTLKFMSKIEKFASYFAGGIDVFMKHCMV